MYAATTCTDCKAATETNNLWNQYNTPRCIHCTARLIKRLGTLPRSTSEVTARRRAVLAGACAWGHSEAMIRQLVKTGPWVEPVAVKVKK